MYVCLCKAVTDSDIQAAMDQGAESLHDVQQSLGVGLGCGRCQATAREVVDAYRVTDTSLFVDVGTNAATA